MLLYSGYGVELMNRMLTGTQMRTTRRKKMKMRMLAKRTLMGKEKIMKKRKMKTMRMRMKRVVGNVRPTYTTPDVTDIQQVDRRRSALHLMWQTIADDVEKKGS